MNILFIGNTRVMSYRIRALPLLSQSSSSLASSASLKTSSFSVLRTARKYSMISSCRMLQQRHKLYLNSINSINSISSINNINGINSISSINSMNSISSSSRNYLSMSAMTSRFGNHKDCVVDNHRHRRSMRLMSTATSSDDKASCSNLPERVLSGVQPTGELHLGNYLGAIQQWTRYQHQYESYFCVVDLHALTVPQDVAKMRENTLKAAAFYIAAGIDTSKSTIFVQSQVPAHAELAWLLNCITPMGWLNRMVQFKEKSAATATSSGYNGDTSTTSNDSFMEGGESVSVGLYDYPVLMAADILLYKARWVPVGDDQKQHLELARAICRRFNDRYPLLVARTTYDETTNKMKTKKQKRQVFVEPQPLITTAGARLMSLTDGTSKMSKSAPNDFSRINVMDSPELIVQKIKRCKTDSQTGLQWDDPNRPECQNLLTLYQAVTSRSKKDIANEVGHMSWGQFKPFLADAVVSFLSPMQKRYMELMKEPTYLDEVLAAGSARANAVANDTLNQVKDAFGLYK